MERYNKKFKESINITNGHTALEVIEESFKVLSSNDRFIRIVDDSAQAIIDGISQGTINFGKERYERILQLLIKNLQHLG